MQTSPDPKCKKDSWQSIHEAIFVPVECIWCKCKFMYDAKTGQSKAVNSKTNKK